MLPEASSNDMNAIFLIVILVLLLFLLVSLVTKSRRASRTTQVIVINQAGIEQVKKSKPDIFLWIMLIFLIGLWITTL